jgi:hypothetical protein
LTLFWFEATSYTKLKSQDNLRNSAPLWGLFHVARVAGYSRFVSMIIIDCRRVCATHCDMAAGYPHDLRFFDETGPTWAALPASQRAAVNRLRKHRNLPQLLPPAVDRSPKPYTPPRKLFDGPNMLARAIVRDGDPDGRLWQELLVQTAATMAAYDGDDPRLKRPAHRPKTLSRKLAEYAVGRALHVWDHKPQGGEAVMQQQLELFPTQRWSLKTLLGVIGRDFGIPRSTALKMLHRIRKCEKRR